MRVLLFTLATCLPALAQQDLPEYWSNVGLMQYESHEYSQAEQALRRSLGMNKSLFVPNLFLGLDLLELKRPHEAVEYLLAAQKSNPQDPQVPLALGRAFHILLDAARSREWYQRAADLAPRNGDAWFGLGVAYLDLAESASAKLLAEFPTSPYVAELKAEARHNSDGGDSVVCEHPKPAEEHPKDAEGWYRSIETYQKLGITALACAGDVQPQSPRIHALLGDAYQQRRMFRQGEDEYSTILALEPDNLGGLAGLAAAYLHDGRLDQARAAAQKALTRDPADSEINLLMGEILVAKKDYAHAEPIWYIVCAHGRIFCRGLMPCLVSYTPGAVAPKKRLPNLNKASRVTMTVRFTISLLACIKAPAMRRPLLRRLKNRSRSALGVAVIFP